MANTCAVCGKIRNLAWRRVKLRGKYNPTVKHPQKPNLQWLTLPSGTRVKACTQCIKTASKPARVKHRAAAMAASANGV